MVLFKMFRLSAAEDSCVRSTLDKISVGIYTYCLKNVLDSLYTAQGNNKGTNEHFFKKKYFLRITFTSAKK